MHFVAVERRVSPGGSRGTTHLPPISSYEEDPYVKHRKSSKFLAVLAGVSLIAAACGGDDDDDGGDAVTEDTGGDTEGTEGTEGTEAPEDTSGDTTDTTAAPV